MFLIELDCDLLTPLSFCELLRFPSEPLLITFELPSLNINRMFWYEVCADVKWLSFVKLTFFESTLGYSPDEDDTFLKFLLLCDRLFFYELGS